jgi:hypothetical protein
LKKIILLGLILLMITTASAQTIESNTENYEIETHNKIHFLGDGVAIYGWEKTQTSVSVANILMGIKKASIAIGSFPARIREMQLPNTTTDDIELIKEFVDVRRMGLLKLDEKKYGLTEITITETSFKGKVYSSPSKNAELIGTFELNKYETDTALKATETWLGNLKIKENEEEKELGLFMTMKKMYTVRELSQKIEHYCLLTENGSPQCLQIKQQNPSVKDFCETNPNDPKCVQLQFEYCATQPDNPRCQNYLINYCKMIPNEENPRFCITTKIEEKLYTSINKKEIKQSKAPEITNIPKTGNAWWNETETINAVENEKLEKIKGKQQQILQGN